MNIELINWLKSQGVIIKYTAPYSPLQNGVAERQNRTLVKLARAMINAQKLLFWLWFQAITHAAYLCNRAYTKALQETPYQRWNHKKPSISHLKEFSTPVYILRQYPKGHKLEPKTKQLIFVGFNNENKSIKYYSPNSNKILYSCSFKFLSSDITLLPIEEIGIAPDIMCKGEKDNDTHKTSAHPETTPETTDQRIQEKQKKQSKYQRDIDDDDDDHTLLPENNMRLRKCPRLDYNQLNKPIFPDKIGDKQLASGETTYATYDASFGGDEPKTLQEAKEIPEWPQLESAIKSKLNQLTKMRTWELVEHPKEIIPIANKCVFQKKYNQIGKIMKYKGRLVAKGCAQHPGFDYNETYPPVIQLEMIRVYISSRTYLQSQNQSNGH